MTVSSTALRPALVNARVLLDEALAGLANLDAPDIPVAAVEYGLVAALDAVYQAIDAAGDPQTFRTFTQAALDHARDALRVLLDRERADDRAINLSGIVAQSVGELLRATQMSFVGSLGIPRQGGRPLAMPASVDLPRRIALPREPVGVAVVVPKPDAPPAPEPVVVDTTPPPPATPAQLADLAAASARALAALDIDDLPPPPPRPAVREEAPPPADDAALARVYLGDTPSPEAVRLEHARVFFEELSMMSQMRQPDPGDVWHELQPLEQRLLARLDALMVLGPGVFPHLIKTLEARPVPDPEMFWGAIFVHGCLVGDDALDAALRLARSAHLHDPAFFDAVTDALVTIPHAGLEPALLEWLRAADPVLRRVAVAVLGRRRALAAQSMVPLLSDADPDVVREAAAALVPLDGPVDRAVLDGMMFHADPAIAHAGMAAATLRAHFRSVVRAAELVAMGHGEHGYALLHLATGGTAEQLPALRSAMAGPPSPLLSEALGWAGMAESVPYLLDRADAGDEAAFVALQRITGASLAEDEPDPLVDPDAPPFTTRFAVPPTELVLRGDAADWRRWWQTYGHRAAPSVRWRHGRPFTLAQPLWELAERDASPWERTWAWMELVARTGRALPFDPRAWVATQRAQIAAWRDYLARRGAQFPEGAWHRGGAT